MEDLVECYSGSRYAERPRAILWLGQRLEVARVLSAGQTPGGRRFRVETRNGQVFELNYDAAEDKWRIEAG